MLVGLMLFVLITKHIFQQGFLACERHHTQEILFSVLANLKVYIRFTAPLQHFCSCRQCWLVHVNPKSNDSGGADYKQ